MRFEVLPPVPAVSTARRLHEIPLFRFASVDELFRISGISQQVRYEKEALVQARGGKAEYIQVLLSGRLRVERVDHEVESMEPPAMLGFREALQGVALEEGARAETESIALVMLADEFGALLSANIELAQGLFRMLLNRNGSAKLETGNAFVFEPRDEPLTNVEKVMYLQTLPLLARATGQEIYELAAIAREVPLDSGSTLFQAGETPSIVLMLSGTLDLDQQDGAPVEVPPGTCLGLRHTLAGTAWPSTATVREAGTALQVERESFFDLLAGRMSLLQVIFGAVFRGKGNASGDASG